MMEPYYGRSKSALSNIFLYVLGLLDLKSRYIMNFNQEHVASILDIFSQKIFNKGAIRSDIWGFIDGTVRGICRPTKRANDDEEGGSYNFSQQSVYCGHKRKHSLTFQAIVTPDGLVAHLFGPSAGRNHDMRLYRESKIADTIDHDERFQHHRIYGDPAYGTNSICCSPYGGAVGNLSEAQKAVNRSMSSVRVSVEWFFGQVVNYWKLIANKWNLRIGLQPVGQLYRVATMLTNCIACARGGNTISDFFDMHPPTLDEYLELMES